MAVRPSVGVALGIVLATLVAGACAGSNGVPRATANALAASAPPASRGPVVATNAEIAGASPTGTSSAAAADPCAVNGADLPVGEICMASFTSADEPAPPYARYTIPTEGWRTFNGAYKDVDGPGGNQRVGALFVMISGLMVDACREQVPSEPAIGATVDDLATALASLPPFEVTAGPTDVTAFGHAGKHLEIRVPLEQPSTGFESFTGCGGSLLKTWISPGHVSSAFNGYTAPGDTEQFWILDVAGQRLVVSALTSANASNDLIKERQALLDSVQIVD